jgi:hypothetical protein
MRIFTAVTSCLLLAISLDAPAMTVEENLIVLEVTGDSPNEQLLINKADTKVKKCKQNVHEVVSKSARATSPGLKSS